MSLDGAFFQTNPSFLFLLGEVADFISDPVRITDFGCRR